MASTPHIGDVGTIVRVTIVEEDDANPGTYLTVDISSSDLRELIFVKQGGTKVTQNAVFTTDGTDGQMEYVVDSSAFWDVAGQWKIQGRVRFPGSPQPEFKSQILTFEVEANL